MTENTTTQQDTGGPGTGRGRRDGRLSREHPG